MKNVGTADRALRVLIGFALLTFALAGERAAWWGWLGLIPLATGLAGYCPVYRLLHMSSGHGMS